MLYGNQLEIEIKDKHLTHKKRKNKKSKRKQFTCHKCGKPMLYVDNTNVMSCECGQYFIFSN